MSLIEDHTASRCGFPEEFGRDVAALLAELQSVLVTLDDPRPRLAMVERLIAHQERRLEALQHAAVDAEALLEQLRQERGNLRLVLQAGKS